MEQVEDENELASTQPTSTNLSETDYASCYGGLQINLNVNDPAPPLKIEVRGFNDLNVSWLSQIYKEHEGKMWTRCTTNIDNRPKFLCIICNKVLFQFCTLRNHLNIHMDIHPYKCCVCPKKYASSSSLYKHRMTKHSNY